MVKHRRQVLISGKMKGIGFAEGGNCLVAPGLRPTIGVKVRMETATDSPVNVSSAAKNGL